MPIRLAIALGGALAATALTAAAQSAAVSGLDLDTIDRSVRPQDDLYRFANGRWLDRTEVPADRVSYGAFAELTDRAESDLHAIINEIGERPRPAGSSLQQIADLFASHMDETRIDALGLEPVRGDLARIDAIRTTSDVAGVAGYLATIAAGAPFAATVSIDAVNPGWLVVRLTQGGTLLPTRDHYLKEADLERGIRAQYAAYLARLFTLAGRRDAEGDARAVLALETMLAAAQLPPDEARGAARAARPQTLGQLRSALPGFDWQAWARPQGLDRPVQIILEQPPFFEAFAALLPKTPVETWQAWLTARFLTAVAPYLPRPFVDLRFEFFGRVMTGQEAPRARWKGGVSLASFYLGDALGRLYVERHFPARARAGVAAIVTGVVRAYRETIEEADWLSRPTRAEAVRKLSALRVKIGHPDRWRDYHGLEIRPDDLLGNILRARRFDNDFRTKRIGGPADAGEWLVAPQTVNAFYNPAVNEIVLPAAFLQPPIFTAGADDAVNYGALGAAVGHELGHGFDGPGRQYDASGRPRIWWTDADERAFGERTRALIAQFDGYRPLPGQSVNGRLTLGENVGDLTGLRVAYRAYRTALGGRPAPVIDGFTGDQRFFIGWAQAWRATIRDDYLREWLIVTPHAPPEYRANGAAANLDAFYNAFGAKPGDRMYRVPERRVRIW